jgi:hypothetical protein
MKNLNNFGVQQLNAVEMNEINGGSVSIVVIEGALDGVKGNTKVWVCGVKVIDQTKKSK